MMRFTALNIFLWLLTAFTLTTQDMVRLLISSNTTAECGKQVTLHCNVSSSSSELSVKHMLWSQNKKPLCHLNSGGEIIHHSFTQRGFKCVYENKTLSLIVEEVQPLESGASKPYMCKLHSNRGISHRYTWIELRESCGIGEAFAYDNGSVCTFNKVHPDGDVRWFRGSHHLSDGSLKQNTSKGVGEGGWLTISSHLGWISDAPSKCCLSTKSGKDIACADVEDRISSKFKYMPRNGVGSLGPLRTILCVSILLAVTMT